MKVDTINPQVDRFIFPVAHDVIVLSSDRLRFLNLGCGTGHLSFEMSCSFTVQVPAQLDSLRKVTSIKAIQETIFSSCQKSSMQEPSTAGDSCPSSSSSAGRLRQEPSDHEELLVTSSLEIRLLEVKSRAQVAREFPPRPQGRLRHQRSRSAGYVCVTNATVRQGRV